MKLSELRNEIPVFLDAGIALEIGSPPGVGKSETIDQIAEELSARDGFEWGISKAFIATYTPVDLLGFMVPGTRNVRRGEDLEEVRVSEFTMPPWMLSTKGVPINEYRRGIVVFEEWDKGEPDVKKASAEILLNGQCGPHKLHDGIGRIALVNRAEDRSGSTKNFDFLINRRCEITVSADVLGWTNWAMGAGVDPLFVAFANKYPESVFANKIPDKQGPFCSPRSLVKAAKLLPARVTADGKMKDDSIASEIAAGMVGQATALQLMAWIKLRHETPDWADIIADPEGCAIPAKPDARMMTCYEAAHHIDIATATPAVTYIKRMPAEFAVTFVKAAIRRNHKLINTPSFMDWVTKNASLLNAIGGAK